MPDVHYLLHVVVQTIIRCADLRNVIFVTPVMRMIGLAVIHQFDLVLQTVIMKQDERMAAVRIGGFCLEPMRQIIRIDRQHDSILRI
ncbi:hypothetical protein D3C71_1640990 [compost metagenome]